MIRSRCACCFLLLCSALPLSSAHAEIPAFPGAEGAGARASGGRPNELGGIVYHVTNLEADPTSSIPGSLRYGLNSDNFTVIRDDWPFPWYNVDIPDSYDVIPRIIVFDVGGTIDIGEVDITPMNVTLAGQTAPGGITLYGGEFNPGHRDSWDEGTPPKVNNLILRHFSVRTHDPAEKDGIWLAGSNSIADHLSLSWYTDEGVSVTDSARDVTVQHSIIGPGWNNPDGDGSQLEGKTPEGEISIHHNLYIHNDARVPRVGEKEGPGIEVDFRNNVIYNYDQNHAGYSVNGEPSFTNFVNNYYIGGYDNSSSNDIFQSGSTLTRIYQSGNLLDMNKNGVADGSDPGWSSFDGSETQLSSPIDIRHGVTQSPAEALDTVVNYAGANWWDRHFLDERSIQQLGTYGQGSVSQTGRVLSSISQQDVDAVVNAPMQTRPAGWDTDNDGMPNYWELERGLDPDTPDWNLDDDNDGYVNLEEYINELGEWPAPYAIEWTGGQARFAEITNWGITRPAPGEAPTTTNWQPSRFDEAVLASGAAFVDAPGQHAGTLRVSGEQGGSSTLGVTDGWLKVHDTLAIGETGDGLVDLTGGRLQAQAITKGAGGVFSFTGGVLSADSVGFDLVSDGGTIAPGQTIGVTSVAGDVTINSGALEIELAAALEADLLNVDGVFTLGGDLIVSTPEGFSVQSEWIIATADQFTGAFDSITPGFGLRLQPGELVLTIVPDLEGDFNGDGVVDTADFTVWRDNLNAEENGFVLSGNGNGGIVDETDYELWRQNFGATWTAPHQSPAAPELATAWLVGAAALLTATRTAGRHRGRHRG